MRRTWRAAVAVVLVTLAACTPAAPTPAPPAPTVAAEPSTPRPSPTPTPDGYDVVAVLGQSNALGWGGGDDEPSADQVDPRIWQWPGSGPEKDTVVPAADPLIGPFTASGVGPAMSFARAYADAHDREVLIVQAAVNGTGFVPAYGMTWDPDLHGSVRNLYDEAVTQVRTALAEAAGNRLVAVLWVQGESDVGRLTPQAYADKLDETVGRLRADLGPAPFVVGQMVPEWVAADPERQAIDAVHQQTPARVTDAVFVPGPTGMTNGPADEIHYDARGQREQGRRMYDAWATVAGS
ncbi:MAG: sialate O-acetylesterase [Cellulomonas sp.]